MNRRNFVQLLSGLTAAAVANPNIVLSSLPEAVRVPTLQVDDLEPWVLISGEHQRYQTLVDWQYVGGMMWDNIHFNAFLHQTQMPDQVYDVLIGGLQHRLRLRGGTDLVEGVGRLMSLGLSMPPPTYKATRIEHTWPTLQGTFCMSRVKEIQRG